MTAADDIRAKRIERQARAEAIAATLPDGDYYAFDSNVIDHATCKIVARCESHWDAVLVIIAVSNRR